MTMPYGYAVWLCRMAMPYGYAVWLCRMAMPYGHAVWLCRMAMYCIIESIACGTKSLMRGLMFERMHLLFYIELLESKIYKHGRLYKNGVQLNDTPHSAIVLEV
jgi:hypothetical protein